MTVAWKMTDSSRIAAAGLRILLSWALALVLVLDTSKAAQSPPPLSPCPPQTHLPCLCFAVPAQDPGALPAVLRLSCEGAALPPAALPGSLSPTLLVISLRQSGLRSLPENAFAHLRTLSVLDLTGNELRRLPERMLDSAHGSLETLRLADNLLGDNLNPVFSAPELRLLRRLRTLDLSNNGIMSLEGGIVDGCTDLQELILSRNDLVQVPSAPTNGPRALKYMALDKNKIGTIRSSAFLPHRQLETIDLSDNGLATIESGAFVGLSSLRRVLLAHNSLKRLDSDVFHGAQNIEILDLSDNLMAELPSVALHAFLYLKILNMSSNSIQTVFNKDLQRHSSLEVLDLSRNSISSLGPGTFLGLRSLRRLDLSVNSLRTVEDDVFDGLPSLSWLSLRDNNVLLVPSSALGRLPRLSHLYLDFNRVAAVSGHHLLPDLAPSLRVLDLSFNVIRELPLDAFLRFSSLSQLRLSGNRLAALEDGSLAGLDRALESLYLDGNRLRRLPPLKLPRLRYLSVARNRLVTFPDLSSTPALEYLVLSENGGGGYGDAAGLRFPPNISLPMGLLSLDLSAVGLRSLPQSPFVCRSLQTLIIRGNSLTRISGGAFSSLPALRTLDLSGNALSDIAEGAFRGLQTLRNLSLAGNRLSSFVDSFFGSVSVLDELDLSNNYISLLSPHSFRVHPHLRVLRLARNRLSLLSPTLFRALPSLRHVDLSQNAIRAVSAGLFSDLPQLRTLGLRDNRIDNLEEGAFSNSSQLQFLDLSGNHIDRLGERAFEGLIRLVLNLSSNRLNSLPDAIFDRSRLHYLESIDLSANLFRSAPIRALSRQFIALSHLSLANNTLRDMPAGDLLLNIKSLDLSSNPLEFSALRQLLSDPKTVRYLRLRDTGLDELPSLETPFLRSLDISANKLSSIPMGAFDRTTLLKRLDISDNSLTEVGESLRKAWPSLSSLSELDLSGNRISNITLEDLHGLSTLLDLRLAHLTELRSLDAAAFRPLSRLKALRLHSLPVLGYLDASGLLDALPATLEYLDVEWSDTTLAEQLSPALRHRLRYLTLRGNRLKALSPGALAGLSAPRIEVRLIDTAVSSIPPTLFFPLPKSSNIVIDVGGAKLNTFPPSLLAAFDSRRDTLTVRGIEGNPINCDCSARPLRRWLLSRRSGQVSCSSPQSLHRRLLPGDVSDEELGCGEDRENSPVNSLAAATSPVQLPSSVKAPQMVSTLPPREPDIIWSLPPPPPAPQSPAREEKTSAPRPASTNDDSLVVGVVGGVVGFVVLLAAGICLARARLSGGNGGRYRGGPLATRRRPTMTPCVPAEWGTLPTPGTASKLPPAIYASLPRPVAPYLVAVEPDRW
ncbi:protein artichoke [Ischnura elegans]|uniref:protein artichoke n=1 Tax=Ischnura elegans TaxID=197161 RepID=UPI001ED89121|nr:protein artichoke [Ischnura elegans]